LADDVCVLITSLASLLQGFAAPDDSKLNFDLRESERRAIRQRPGSVQWSQFEQSGFVFANDGLSTVLSFDDGLQDDIQRWPAERAELMEKIRKTTKNIPAFPYDTTPAVVASPSKDKSSSGQWETKPISRFDDVFAEVYADTMLGNGWSNRDELTHRNSNFVVVQYKSRPTPSTVGSQSRGSSDPTQGYAAGPDDRVDAAWFVVEEIVPQKYRTELEASGRHKNKSGPSLRKLNIFKKRKEDVGGSKAITPFDRSSFDELFRPGLGGVTKKLQLGKDPTSPSTLERKSSASTVRMNQFGSGGEEFGGSVGSGSKLMTTLRKGTIKMRKLGKADDDPLAPPAIPPKATTTVLPASLPTTIPTTTTTTAAAEVRPSPSFGTEDFDTRSLHDAELDNYAVRDAKKRNVLQRSSKRGSKDDSWLDIMIRSNGFRMAGQDSILSPRGTAVAAVASSQKKTPDVASKAVIVPQSSSNGGLESSSSAPPTPPSPPREEAVKRVLKRKDIPEPGVPIPTNPLQIAGWTREDTAAATTPALAPPLPSHLYPPQLLPDGQSLESSSKPGSEYKTGSESSPRPPSVERMKQDSPTLEQDPSPRESPAQLAYLRPLPPLSSLPKDMDERERAREARIQAAKDRAKELRAGLNQVVIQELESKKEGTKPVTVLLTPTKTPTAESKTPSPEPSTSPFRKNLSPKDDPFAKDRFSGRVASVANKFGGVGAKPLTPQSTGNSMNAAGSSPTRGESVPSSLPLDRITPGLFGSSGSKPAKARPDSSPMLDPNEPGSRLSLESNNALGFDNDSIYPEDAASNFSRDTEPEEFMYSRTSSNGGNSASLRQGGSIAAVTASASPSSREVDSLLDAGRREAEDHVTAMPPGFRAPYQPGMPLSNLEEESESVLSGSNAA
jgi:hypothetical protein